MDLIISDAFLGFQLKVEMYFLVAPVTELMCLSPLHAQMQVKDG